MTNSAGPRKLGRTLLLAVLWIAALGSLVVGLRDGLHSGLDFQWSGARLLAHGVDPWKTYLLGDPNHEIILGHQPNYLPELYLIMLPFGMMTFPTAVVIWCGMNLLFIAASIFLVARLYRLDRYNTWILAAIMLLSTPLRVSLVNGQQSLFALFFFALAFTLAAELWRGLALGLCFAKYSFAPILVFLDLMRLRLKLLIGIAIPIVLGILIVWRMTGSTLSEILLEPLRVPRIADSTGAADIMTLAEIYLPLLHLSRNAVFSLSGAIGLTCALVCALFLYRKRLKAEVEIAFIATMTLFCLKHLPYDDVFLVFPLAVLLRWNREISEDVGERQLTARVVGWIAIMWVLIGSTVRRALYVDYLVPAVVSTAIALIVVAIILLRAERANVITESELQA
jgi:hypothetical protein